MSFLVLLKSILLVLALGMLGGRLSRFLGQPAVVGQLLFGVVAGPSFLGGFDRELSDSLFSLSQNREWLRLIEQVSVGLFLLATGLELDLNLVWRERHKTKLVSFAGLVPSFFLGFFILSVFPNIAGAETSLRVQLFLGAAMAISALPVIAGIMLELGLFHTPVTAVIISSAVVCDLVAWLVIGICLAAGAWTASSIFYHVMHLILFFALLVYFVRPLLTMLLEKIPLIKQGAIPVVIALTLLVVWGAKLLGINPGLSYFSFGILVASTPFLSSTQRTKLLTFAMGICAPFYFALVGLELDVLHHFYWQSVLLLFVLASLLKIIPCYFASWKAGFHWKEACCVAVGLNVRGAVDILIARTAFQSGLIDPKLFMALVFTAIFTSMLAGPVIRALMLPKIKVEAVAPA